MQGGPTRLELNRYRNSIVRPISSRRLPFPFHIFSFLRDIRQVKLKMLSSSGSQSMDFIRGRWPNVIFLGLVFLKTVCNLDMVHFRQQPPSPPTSRSINGNTQQLKFRLSCYDLLPGSEGGARGILSSKILSCTFGVN